MHTSDFMGRSEELKLLDNLGASAKASLLILYGRRRVGKTRLLTHWLQAHSDNALYWVAEPTSAFDQLRSFSQALNNFATPDTPAPAHFTYGSWEHALRQAAQLANSRRRLVLFIDEVTYLMDVNPAIAGTLQKAWDSWLSKSNIFLALSGSHMGLMQKEMLSYQAPLYGRATAQVKLAPLPYGVTSLFFPYYNAVDRVTVYAAFGGIPAYWERLDENQSIMANIQRLLLSANALMHEEPRLLLNDFINDPHNYVAIIRAIASGAHGMSEISQYSGLSTNLITKYMGVLRDTGFVERRAPITENAEDSRRGRYFITDPYLRFYYRFVGTYQSMVALGEQGQMMETIEQNLPQFIQDNTWQDMCREWTLRASARGHIPLEIEKVESAWTRTFTFDVVGIHWSKRQMVVGNCYWRDDPMDLSAISELISRTSSLLPDEGEWTIYYVGFASSGWTATAHEQIGQVAQTASQGKRWRVAGTQLVDLAQVDADLTAWTTGGTP